MTHKRPLILLTVKGRPVERVSNSFELKTTIAFLISPKLQTNKIKLKR